MKRSLVKAELSLGITIKESLQDRANEVEGQIRKVCLKIRKEAADIV